MYSDLYFRYGIKELFAALHVSGVHCYIVSAGLKPIINQAFSIFEGQAGVTLADRITVCSSEEEYNEQNYIYKFKAPLITCFNKFLLFTHTRYPEIKPASNAIVVGDLIDDLSMTSSLNLSTKLTIGMLNSKVRKRVIY